MTVEVRPARESELDQHAALHDEGYGLTPGTGRAFVDGQIAAGLVDRMLGAYDGSRLVGKLMVLPFGQFFGGRPLPMGGIGAVVVAADQRGRGVGRALLDGALAHMRTHGEVISALSPATVPVYRKAGWEIAGEKNVYAVTTHDLALLPRSSLRERPATPDDEDAIKRTYVRAAATRNGMLARPAFVWARRLADQPGCRRYVVEHNGEVSAYISHTPHPRSTWGYRLFVDDLAALDWESELALWNHLAAHRAQCDDVSVMGVPLDELALHLPEPAVRLAHPDPWMLRLVDLPGAIAGRGFPPSITAAVSLHVSDERVAANNGHWTLEVDHGRGALTPVADGAGAPATSPTITINGLAPLFSSARSARTLAGAGLLTGASGEQLALLDALFAGPAPAMNDRF